MKRLLIPGAIAAVALMATIMLTINTTDVYNPEYVDLTLVNQTTYYYYRWWAGMNKSALEYVDPAAGLLKFGATYRGIDSGRTAEIYFVGSIVVYINATNTAILRLYDIMYDEYIIAVGDLESGIYGPFNIRIIQRTDSWTLFRVEGRQAGAIKVGQPVAIRFP